MLPASSRNPESQQNKLNGARTFEQMWFISTIMKTVVTTYHPYLTLVLMKPEKGDLMGAAENVSSS